MTGFVEIKKTTERKIKRLEKLGADSSALFLMNSQVERATVLYERSKEAKKYDKDQAHSLYSRSLNKIGTVEELIVDYRNEFYELLKTTNDGFDEV